MLSLFFLPTDTKVESHFQTSDAIVKSHEAVLLVEVGRELIDHKILCGRTKNDGSLPV